jgi:hypothetical protein
MRGDHTDLGELTRLTMLAVGTIDGGPSPRRTARARR